MVQAPVLQILDKNFAEKLEYPLPVYPNSRIIKGRYIGSKTYSGLLDKKDFMELFNSQYEELFNNDLFDGELTDTTVLKRLSRNVIQQYGNLDKYVEQLIYDLKNNINYVYVPSINVPELEFNFFEEGNLVEGYRKSTMQGLDISNYDNAVYYFNTVLQAKINYLTRTVITNKDADMTAVAIGSAVEFSNYVASIIYLYNNKEISDRIAKIEFLAALLWAGNELFEGYFSLATGYNKLTYKERLAFYNLSSLANGNPSTLDIIKKICMPGILQQTVFSRVSLRK